MIRVTESPEPPRFDELVKVPGQEFLATNPTPKWNEFKPLWRAILGEIRDAYRSVCAYSCHFVPFDTGGDTVEHYRPKTLYPQLAYEWSNYRFVCSRLNGRKGNFEDVLDPFQIENGWFVIDFPSLLVKPGREVTAAVREQVLASISRLKLNDEATCVRQRSYYVNEFLIHGRDYFDRTMRRDAPFLAAEIDRQGLIDSLPTIMSVES